MTTDYHDLMHNPALDSRATWRKPGAAERAAAPAAVAIIRLPCCGAQAVIGLGRRVNYRGHVSPAVICHFADCGATSHLRLVGWSCD
ncbi:MAG: hypothetical protein OEW11_09490 [Nitrospirota bacterium]|nr:hypothetical protein [Nitrospirota bacterium]